MLIMSIFYCICGNKKLWVSLFKYSRYRIQRDRLRGIGYNEIFYFLVGFVS